MSSSKASNFLKNSRYSKNIPLQNSNMFYYHEEPLINTIKLNSGMLLMPLNEFYIHLLEFYFNIVKIIGLKQCLVDFIGNLKI